MTIESVVEQLRRLPLRAYDDVAPRAPDGPPKAPGLYAWWQVAGALPDVTAPPHPTDPAWELLYVGIAPRGESSKGTLRRRLANHHGAAIGRSTLRLTLAALLWEREGWTPTWTDRPVLPPSDLAALATWQREHLRVQWAEHPAPWASATADDTVESLVIKTMGPALNRDHNAKSTEHEKVGQARDALRRAARAGVDGTE